MSSPFYQLSAAALIKQQPSYKLLMFILNGKHITVGLNDEAFHTIRLCDGTRTFDQIAFTIAGIFNTSLEDASNKIKPFLNELVNIGLVLLHDRPSDAGVRLLGSSEFYTPEQVVIELTHRCPLSCIHCYLNAGKGIGLSEASLTTIIDELIDLIGARGIQLTGGEPFANPNIHKAIQKLTGSVIPIQITTSGYLLDEQIKKSLLLLTNPSCSIQISLDGLEKSHNAIRRNNEAFCRAIKFIKYCVENGIKVSTATVLINQDENEINQLCSLAKSLGVSLFRMGLLTSQGRAVSLHSSFYSVEQFKKLLHELKLLYEDDYYGVGYIDENMYTGESCGAGYKLIVIEPDLSVRPCLLIPYRIGTIKDTSIIKFSEQNAWRFIHFKAPSRLQCTSCELSERCNGCIAEGVANHSAVKNCEWANRNRDIFVNLGVRDFAQS